VADVSLVYVPFGALERPSLGLGLLKAALTAAGIHSEVRYSTFAFAERIGMDLYGKLASVREEMLGEWLFSRAAFPDFNTRTEEYLRHALDSFFESSQSEARDFSRRYLLFAREESVAFIEEEAQAVVDRGTRILGCSSTFNQNCAMLALTRQVKQLNPQIVTIVGGANCESAMGAAMVRCFPWLDYVASGESEQLFPQLCARILDGGLNGSDPPYGIMSRHAATRPLRLAMAGAERPAPPRATVEDMNAVPVPDFVDYFDALGGFTGRDSVVPGLVAETARGCWWGAKHHCTFCGLSDESMKFRSKTPARVVAELGALSSTYGVRRFLMADNILDYGYYKALLPQLGEVPEGYNFYFEIKANVSYEQLSALKRAGVRWLLAGIESLHDDVLRLMDKGTSGFANVQLLKWARELGIHVSWNMLCGLPGEDDAWYADVARWLPAVYHLEPPVDVRTIRFDRFSPYHSAPERYGLRLRPSWPYPYIYPLNDNDLTDLVYFFEAEGRAPARTNPFRHNGSSSGLPSLGGPGRDRLQQRVREWVRLFRSSSPPVLHVVEHPDHVSITDTRSIAADKHFELSGLACRIYRLCERPVTERAIMVGLARDGGPATSPDRVTDVLEHLLERHVLLQSGDRYLALGVRGEMPTLPWRNQDGYPGGWIITPEREALPKRFQEASTHEVTT